ncbi:sugar transferase [Hungatella effluvii]|uniref:sugar transferase n=1 Tax=Hungatella effluvii TaxID=1096246 RepID=UPI0022E3753B|nr:sugar transferase [Hungatella effluvii]
MGLSKGKLYPKYIKRILDFIVSLLALIILSPILLVVSILVRMKLGSPVIFKQARPGKAEKIFQLYKFRSMTEERGSDGKLLSDAKRLTKFGKFLRASSIDELLEFVNIVKGDMSIVGPRPLSIYYLPHYSKEQRRRHDVLPGLTGLAQVNGRNNLPWDDRFAMDNQYVDNVTLLGDVKIILNTVLKVAKHADISVRGTSKVKDFGPYSILKEEGKGTTQMFGMTYSEIGSYFWMNRELREEYGLSWLPAADDSTFTFSGRTAIDIALRDILSDHEVSKVYAPSYCCISMLQAFIDRDIKIEYYKVEINDKGFTYNLPTVEKGAVVLIMGYFCISTEGAHNAIEELHKQEVVVIEDITHSMFSKNGTSPYSDYLVASLRKWFPTPAGGWLGKRKGTLYVKPDIDSNHAVEDKISAMKEKYAYLKGDIDSKENFLLIQAKFDNDLIHVDRMLKLDDTSVDILQHVDVVEMVKARRGNAAKLMRGLSDLEGKVLSLSAMDLSACTPLFYPIFMKNKDRDSLRKYLVNKGIYCPVHWPEVIGAPSGVRENELSLICDQRYTENDMQVMTDCIHQWYAESKM